MIPTYNQAKFITKAVESALAQDYANLEIVIADDCSTDNTGEIVQPYLIHGKIKYIKNRFNIGRVANYRKCLYEYTDADWVINLDGDDYYTNNQYISQAMRAIQTAGIHKILFYQGVNFLKNDKREKLLEPKIKSVEICIAAKEYFLGYFKRDSFSHMSTLYNRHLAMECNFYSMDIISSDIFSLLSLCLKFSERNVIVSKLVSGAWVQHKGNATRTKDFKVHKDNFKLYTELHRHSIKKHFGIWQCRKWFVKAGYAYLKNYAYGVLKVGRKLSR